MYVGCAGYSYPDWKGSFYPKGYSTDRFLAYYARFFNFVEINSSFYNLPAPTTVEHWDEHTPSDFKFSIKIWQAITHRGVKRKNAPKLDTFSLEDDLIRFFARFEALSEKIAVYLLQFPPSFSHSEENSAILRTILSYIPESKRVAVELRHNSWLKHEILDRLLAEPNLTAVTSYIPKIHPYNSATQSFSYIRLIGDRELESFKLRQRDAPTVLEAVHSLVDVKWHSPEITDIFVIFNNHFQGFSPLDVNEFKAHFGLPVKSFQRQKSLLDFV